MSIATQFDSHNFLQYISVYFNQCAITDMARQILDKFHQINHNDHARMGQPFLLERKIAHLLVLVPLKRQQAD